MLQDCDVLIIGAGPVGTALALELALHGVSFCIVDQAPARSDKSRALNLQPRTLELLNRHGAADEIIRRGRIVRGGATYIHGEVVASMSLDDLGITNTEFPLPLSVSQAVTESFLDECLARYGLAVQRPIKAIGIVQDDSGVTTTLEVSDGSIKTMRSLYVVGCDGAHSVVRHAAGLEFEGAAYPQDFVLCDAHLRDTRLDLDRLTMCLGSSGLLAILPLQGQLVRLIASRNHVPEGQEEPTLELFQNIFNNMTPPGSGTLHDPVWLSRFRLHHRCVDRYRNGRLFVAGDAAHIHSPAGGQDMNTGIQDAINLGWKLAAALNLLRFASSSDNSSSNNPAEFESAKSKARALSEALLNSYNVERRPVGLALLRGTDRLFTLMTSTHWLLASLRNISLRYALPWMASSLSRRRYLFSFISQLGISYHKRESVIVGTAPGWNGPVRGGDRLADGKIVASGQDKVETMLQRICMGREWHLVVFVGCEADEQRRTLLRTAIHRVVSASKWDLKTHYIVSGEWEVLGDSPSCWYADLDGALHVEFGFSKTPGYVLVRPDGYVGYIGPWESLDYLIRFVGL